MTLEEIRIHSKEFEASRVAIRKMQNKEGWYPFYFEAAKGGMIVRGAILREVTRGPNKGQMTARGCKVDELVISSSELSRETSRMNKETKGAQS